MEELAVCLAPSSRICAQQRRVVGKILTQKLFSITLREEIHGSDGHDHSKDNTSTL
jgi:hypothetical protein